LSALLRKPWVAATVIGIFCYFLAIADTSKYEKLGTRITIDDLLMVPDIGKLWSFAKKGGGGVPFRVFYLVSALLLVCYIFILFYKKSRIPAFSVSGVSAM
jgi:hypothetical protein